MCPSNEACASFWEKIGDHPLLEGHPVHARRDLPCDWRRLAVPFSIHGDGVPCVGVGKTWSKSMELLSWASCLVKGNTIDTFLHLWFICALYFYPFRSRHRPRILEDTVLELDGLVGGEVPNTGLEEQTYPQWQGWTTSLRDGGQPLFWVPVYCAWRPGLVFQKIKTSELHQHEPRQSMWV